MKKLAIAGASVALAAMPVVGVFAADNTTQTDTLQITITKVCSFGHQDPASGADAGSVINVAAPSHGAGGAGMWSENTLSKTMSTATATTDEGGQLGTTILNVYCNDEQGYSITTSTESAKGTTTGELSLPSGNTNTNSIPVNASFSAASSGWSYKVAAGSNNRTTVRSAEGHNHTQWATSSNYAEVITDLPASGSKTTANIGDTFTVTYGVGIDQNQGAGVYSGSITYTLAALGN